ncbi:MAG: 50S ribosomal protein L15 [Spirochaetes bacterium GWD1_27_9]|nr:MAG: 50S ribosomal protein L15 [Spirochaetes bacterium GWB1_27_13]OHD21039.1 MAG: 50S ribosomal protein L15 [Spirochaetes bacterium GWC1_27_15]OHD45400.1 MAG: 50S ribosomal protein L15 [Spirochaetes bacterium GWD1_27_9]
MEKILVAPKGSSKNRKRIGRGIGSGTGKTSGKGHKGQNSRKGGGVRLGFEGGQTPLYRRIPKRGFKNSKFKTEYNEVNVYLLNNFTKDSVVKFDDFEKAGLIDVSNLPVKILGNGELKVKLEVHANKFTKSALEKIEKSGGKAVQI